MFKKSTIIKVVRNHHLESIEELDNKATRVQEAKMCICIEFSNKFLMYSILHDVTLEL